MTRYGEWSPTGFDPRGLALPDRQDWIVAPCMLTRDSGSLEKANWRAQLAELGGESESVEVHRFGHWACGWFEIALVAPERADQVEALERTLEDYPVLDDNALAEAELEDEDESWDAWGAGDFSRALERALREDDPDIGDRIDALTPDQLLELYRRACDAAGVPSYCEHHSDGPHFFIDRAVECVAIRDIDGASRWQP